MSEPQPPRYERQDAPAGGAETPQPADAKPRRSGWTAFFAVIGMQQTQPTAHDRSTICFKVIHSPGTLVEVLQHFSDHRINLLCIDSRPTRDTPWAYLFYVDVEGHRLAEPLRSCLEELKAICPVCKVLGSYPED